MSAKQEDEREAEAEPKEVADEPGKIEAQGQAPSSMKNETEDQDSSSSSSSSGDVDDNLEDFIMSMLGKLNVAEEGKAQGKGSLLCANTQVSARRVAD